MKVTAAILVTLFATMALSKNSSTRRAQLPSVVRQSIIEYAKVCTDAGGAPGKSPDLIRYADLNGDGMEDYILDMGAFTCEGAASAMANGQAGWSLTIFVGGPRNTATKTYSDSIYGSRIDRSRTRPRLYVDVAAQRCGQRNADNLSFAQWAFCSRPLNWNAGRHAFVLAPMSEKRTMVVDIQANEWQVSRSADGIANDRN